MHGLKSKLTKFLKITILGELHFHPNKNLASAIMFTGPNYKCKRSLSFALVQAPLAFYLHPSRTTTRAKPTMTYVYCDPDGLCADLSESSGVRYSISTSPLIFLFFFLAIFFCSSIYFTHMVSKKTSGAR